jgi:CIC family chloride channel protein
MGDRQQVAMQLLGRVLLHAALVGAAAGLVGSLFVAGLELTQMLFLQRLAGYLPLRADGEQIVQSQFLAPFRPWLLWAVPAVGALAAGAISARFAPETRGGGSDSIIESFHVHDGVVRRRVPIVKAIASIFTLGFGGSGGREGPTMQIGGALGSIVGRYLKVSPRERRILLVAGTAAGMAAVFRTPLGAALLAVEVLHRDDFESDACSSRSTARRRSSDSSTTIRSSPRTFPSTR